MLTAFRQAAQGEPSVVPWHLHRAGRREAAARHFKRAGELAPDRLPYAYRHAEAYYDLETPQWDEALKAWGALEERAKPGIEQETIRLQAANVLLKLGQTDHARLLLANVTQDALQKQKQTLLDQLAQASAK